MEILAMYFYTILNLVEEKMVMMHPKLVLLVPLPLQIWIIPLAPIFAIVEQTQCRQQAIVFTDMI